MGCLYEMPFSACTSSGEQELVRLMGLQPGRMQDVQSTTGRRGAGWGGLRLEGLNHVPSSWSCKQQEASSPRTLCVRLWQGEELSCFLTAAGSAGLMGHCSPGSTEGAWIRQPLFYFTPTLRGTARTSSGLAPSLSFRDLGKRGDKEHCAPLHISAGSAFPATPTPSAAARV